MIEREYRIRKLSNGSGYVVIILRGLHDVETLPRVYANTHEARTTAKAHSRLYGYKPLIIVE